MTATEPETSSKMLEARQALELGRSPTAGCSGRRHPAPPGRSRRSRPHLPPVRISGLRDTRTAPNLRRGAHRDPRTALRGRPDRSDRQSPAVRQPLRRRCLRPRQQHYEYDPTRPHPHRKPVRDGRLMDPIQTRDEPGQPGPNPPRAARRSQRPASSPAGNAAWSTTLWRWPTSGTCPTMAAWPAPATSRTWPRLTPPAARCTVATGSSSTSSSVPLPH